MKKSYLYFLIPVIAVGLFAIYYAKYASYYQAKLDAAQQAILEKHNKELEKEAADRKKAIDEAEALAMKRKAEIAMKAAEQAAEAAAREQLIQERNKAEQDSRKYAEQVTDLKKQAAENNDAIAKIQRDEKDLRQQEQFLRDYVTQSDANTKYLTSVVEKIRAANQARAAAAAAAAAKKS